MTDLVVTDLDAEFKMTGHLQTWLLAPTVKTGTVIGLLKVDDIFSWIALSRTVRL